MGMEIEVFREIFAVPGVSREQAFEHSLLSFYEAELNASGFAGMDLHVAYDSNESLQYDMGNFRGVAQFYDTLAELSGAPGNSLDAEYQGPLRPLFQSREWMGPYDCSAIRRELNRCDALRRSEQAYAIILRHGWTLEGFAEYFASWHHAFSFAGANSAIHFY